MNGIGSDAFAMFYKNGNLLAVRRGNLPTWTPKRFSKCSQLPTEGWESVTVPGQYRLGYIIKTIWKVPSSKFLGQRLNLPDKVFMFLVAYRWELQSSRFVDNSNFVEAFMPNGHAPKAGDLFLSKTQGIPMKNSKFTGQAFYVGNWLKK